MSVNKFGKLLIILGKVFFMMYKCYWGNFLIYFFIKNWFKNNKCNFKICCLKIRKKERKRFL